jgi:hypothetical protein
VVDLYDDTVMTLQSDGTLAIVGSEGSLDPGATDNVHDFAALAWLGEVKPNPWFSFPDFQQLFDAAPITPVPDEYSSPTDPVVSTDAAAEGAYSLYVNANNDDQYVGYQLPNTALSGYGWPLAEQWVYFSFALFIPAVSDPSQYADLFSWGQDVYIYTDGTSAYLRMQFNSDEFFSDTFSVGAWHAIQIAFRSWDGSNGWQVQFWIDGVTDGLHTATSSGQVPSDVWIGDYSHAGAGDEIAYYFDAFSWSVNSMPPQVDLSGAFFNGVGSGTNWDAITGEAESGHPVDDSYTAIVDHPLIVPGTYRDPANYYSFSPNYFPLSQSGVLANDGLATTATLNTGPTHGTLVYFNSDGSFRYDPDPGYVGVDTFTYDGNGGTATVTITIVEVTALHPVFDNRHGFRAAT